MLRYRLSFAVAAWLRNRADKRNRHPGRSVAVAKSDYRRKVPYESNLDAGGR